jgi:hypothetical protein
LADYEKYSVSSWEVQFFPHLSLMRSLTKKILVEALMHLNVIEEPGTIVDLTETQRIKAGEGTVWKIK